MQQSNFNPRTPRGVRRSKRPRRLDRSSISIHAPREGCDAARRARLRIRPTFQSTHPARGATEAAPLCVGEVAQFQSTHPARGATSTPCATIAPGSYFNPRTPRGVRPNGLHACAASAQFQSTHPARGATVRFSQRVDDARHFNPRTPRGVRQQKRTNFFAHFRNNRQLGGMIWQNAVYLSVLRP